jgi:hypothetical protein
MRPRDNDNYMGEISMERIVDVNGRMQPEWVRPIDAAAACGLRKSRLYELLNEANGRIKTLVLKSPGAKKGARLIHLPSLFTYLEQLAEQQQMESNS